MAELSLKSDQNSNIHKKLKCELMESPRNQIYNINSQYSQYYIRTYVEFISMTKEKSGNKNGMSSKLEFLMGIQIQEKKKIWFMGNY